MTEGPDTLFVGSLSHLDRTLRDMGGVGEAPRNEVARQRRLPPPPPLTCGNVGRLLPGAGRRFQAQSHLQSQFTGRCSPFGWPCWFIAVRGRPFRPQLRRKHARQACLGAFTSVRSYSPNPWTVRGRLTCTAAPLRAWPAAPGSATGTARRFRGHDKHHDEAEERLREWSQDLAPGSGKLEAGPDRERPCAGTRSRMATITPKVHSAARVQIASR
jgi:hypothetical protein